MSRWRVLTSYLVLEPSKNPAYLAQRDSRVSELSQTFSRAFAPWKSSRYTDQDRIRSLTAILTDAADLGVWLFAQPSNLQFHWPRNSASSIAVTPSLVKTTDEQGQTLTNPQVMIEADLKGR